MRPLPDQRSYSFESRRVGLALLILFALAALGRTPTPSAATSSATVFLPLIARALLCFPTHEAYPIAVADSLLNEKGFVKPDYLYSDEIYKSKTGKRVDLRSPTNPNGGITWLSWRAGSATIISFTASLSGSGSLAQGFDEAPWPPSNSLNLSKPPSYPFYPHRFNTGDWVYKYPGIVNAAAVRAALDEHISDRTLMILPITSAEAGSVGGGTTYIIRPGAFLLRGYSFNGVGYLDLVYIGEPGLAPCTS